MAEPFTRKKGVFIYLVVGLVLLGTVFALLERGPGRQSAAVAILFTARVGSFNHEGPWPPGARFCITNNTPKTVRVVLGKIEVRGGSQWNRHSALAIPAFTLAPHAGMYANIEPAVLPGGAWRIEGRVAETLTGWRREFAAAKMLARNPLLLRYTGVLFATNQTYYGGSYEVISQEVPEHK